MAVVWKKIAFEVLTTRGDLIRRGAADRERLAKGTEGHVLTMGADDPGWVAPSDGGGAPTASGNYSGNSTANRAIPHGLGVIPKIVLLTDTGSYFFRIYGGVAKVLYQQTSVSGQYAVTTPNATNFYVGNASNYYRSANAAGNYFWVAIG